MERSLNATIALFLGCTGKAKSRSLAALGMTNEEEERD
jgi:hypothetical protein